MKPIHSMDGWMRDQERRALALERRGVPQAEDLVGPYIGMQATQIADWNDDATGYCGFFFSAPGAANAPDGTNWWIGYSLADDTGNGIQTVHSYTSGVAVINKVREFNTTGTAVRVFGAWASF